MCEICSWLSTNTGFCKAVLPQKPPLLSPLTFANVFKLKIIGNEKNVLLIHVSSPCVCLQL